MLDRARRSRCRCTLRGGNRRQEIVGLGLRIRKLSYRFHELPIASINRKLRALDCREAAYGLKSDANLAAFNRRAQILNLRRSRVDLKSLALFLGRQRLPRRVRRRV